MSLSPSVTDTLVELGLGDEIVGVSVFCKRYAPEHTVVAGDYVRPWLEVIKKLAPSIVFTSGAAQERAASLLRSHGYHVVHLELPSSLYGIADMAWSIGVYTGRTAEARELSQRLMEEINDLYLAAPRLRVFYVIDLGEPVSPGALSYAGHALSHIGLVHPYQSSTERWITPSPSTVKEFRPELVVYEAKTEKPSIRLALNRLKAWNLLSSIGDARILTAPVDTLAHYGPKITKRARWLIDLLSSRPRDEGISGS